MANSVDPDEMARYESSHLDLHCLYRYWFWSAGLKGLHVSMLKGKQNSFILKIVFHSFISTIEFLHIVDKRKL